MLSNFSFGQVTFEHFYITEGFNNNPKTFGFHTDAGLNFYTISETENKVFLYDSLHTLYKTISLNLGANFDLGTIYLLTDKLFNQDSKIEFIAVSTTGSPEYLTKITLFDEDGVNLFEFGDRWEANYIKVSDTSFKLIVSTDKVSPNTYDVYNLTGTLQ